MWNKMAENNYPAEYVLNFNFENRQNEYRRNDEYYEKGSIITEEVVDRVELMFNNTIKKFN